MENHGTIRVELYDNVLLKDGKTATIIEIHKIRILPTLRLMTAIMIHNLLRLNK